MENKSHSSVSPIGKKSGIDRFSDRVENYIKFRPHYPVEIISLLKQEGLLTKDTVVADIGSGTGLLSELFLKEGNVVYGVEPNKEMRQAGQKMVGNYKSFCTINGTAENTGLPTDDIDLIVCGQSFHWFDMEKCRLEFQRILKTDGEVVLIWNDRRTESTEFLKAYENFIRQFASDYLEIKHKNIDEKIFTDFFKNNYKMKSFSNFQYFDFEGLKGRTLSTSYMPLEGEPNFEKMLKELKNLFDRFAEKGKVTMEYDTNLYYGKLH